MVETEWWPVASLVLAPIVSAVVGAAVASRQARKEREKRDDERFEREQRRSGQHVRFRQHVLPAQCVRVWLHHRPELLLLLGVNMVATANQPVSAGGLSAALKAMGQFER